MVHRTMDFYSLIKNLTGAHFQGLGLTYDDVLLVPGLNGQGSRANVSLEQWDRSKRFHLKIPFISANMDRISGFEMCDFMESVGAFGAMHRLMPLEANLQEFEKSRKNCFVSIGCNEKGLERAEVLYNAGARFINLDIAHGHSTDMKYTLEELKKRYSDLFVMAGNVATLDGAQYLYDHGADMVKVGIGGGSACTTRVKTGFGVPNISALQECSKVKCSIVADGGIRNPADVVKALAFGADFVMLGSLLAGTDQSPGEIIDEGTPQARKIYRGLDSRETQMDWFGQVPKWRTPEGVTTYKPYAGDANVIIEDLVGGLRSGLTYCGVSDISELQKKFRYRIVSSASILEGEAHGLKGARS